MTIHTESIALELISVLLDWQSLRSVSATATKQAGGKIVEFEIQANPSVGSWRSQEQTTGSVASFDPALGTHLDSGQTLPAGSPPHESVRLLFPLHLSIWGRKQDYFRLVSAERSGNEGVLLLRHPTDRGLYGSVTVDLDVGLATRFVSPIESWQLSNVSKNQSESSFAFVAI
jgi:hypothetical protein